MLERLESLATKYPIDIVAHLVILIPVLVGVARFSYLKRDMKLVMLFLIGDFSTETMSLLSMLRGGTTVHMLDIRASLNIALVTSIYGAALIRPRQQKIMVGVGILFFLFSVIAYSGRVVAPWSQTAFRVFAIGATLAYYNAILADLNLKKIHHHSMFWFTMGLLFYVGGTLFSMLFNQYLHDEATPAAISDQFTVLSQSLYIAFCLLATLGFWVSKYDLKNYFERNYFTDNVFKDN
ncbi:MAG: hypothetical protein H7Z72_01530 [Bacteroidetes bacterium]|nr:hypothetical protein [Fibrella sp.]